VSDPVSRRYLNGATVMTTPTPRQVEVARAAGFAGIEARAERLLADPAEVRATAGLVNEGEVWSLNGLRIGVDADADLDRAMLEADLAARLEICRAIGAAYLLVVPPRLPGRTADEVLPAIRDGLSIALERTATTGIRLAFEFLGFGDSPIGTPDAAGSAVDGLAGVDLVLDSCHWHASGSGPFERFPVERLAMVHLNDAPEKDPRAIEDGDRLLPGEGVIRLADLIGALRGRGYDGPWSLETFNPRYWDEDPEAVARRGAAAIGRALDTG
jgi:sugar phosphate isomerase/epimerase